MASASASLARASLGILQDSCRRIIENHAASSENRAASSETMTKEQSTGELQTLQTATKQAAQHLVSALKSIEKVTKEQSTDELQTLQIASELQALQNTAENMAAKRRKLDEKLELLTKVLAARAPRTPVYVETLSCLTEVAAARAATAARAAAAAAATAEQAARDLVSANGLLQEFQYRSQAMKKLTKEQITGEPDV